MYKMVILSRDWQSYKDLIEKNSNEPINLIFADDNTLGASQLDEAEIILADPSLIAPNLNECIKVKWLQSTWAGMSPVLGSTKKDYMLTGVKNVFGPQMCEYVFSYLLYFSRKIALFSSLQAQKSWQPPELTSLKGKTLGIMGVGSIGKDVAGMAKQFGMKVYGLTHSSRDCSHVDEYFDFEHLSLFANKLDYLVCLLPSTSQTKNLINQHFLSSLPQHCALINVGRGSVIDDQALMNALQNKSLSAAVLDVFSQEPLEHTHPFWETPNLYITQHTAAISVPQDVFAVFAENLQLFHQHKKLNFLVDWSKGY